jgi:hypothetical protein
VGVGDEVDGEGSIGGAGFMVVLFEHVLVVETEAAVG